MEEYSVTVKPPVPVPAEAAEATGTEDDDDDDCELVVPLSPLEPLLSHPAPAAPAAAAPAAAAAAPTKVVAGRGYPVFISLSGGVDSMVIAKILAVLRARRHAPPTTATATATATAAGAVWPIGPIVAAHIDYANRAESSQEAAYVRRWCEEMDIEFRCRVVDEVRGWVRASGLF